MRNVARVGMACLALLAMDPAVAPALAEEASVEVSTGCVRFLPPASTCLNQRDPPSEDALFSQSQGRARVAGRQLVLPKDDGTLIELPRYESESEASGYFDSIMTAFLGGNESLGFWKVASGSSVGEIWGESLLSMKSGAMYDATFATFVGNEDSTYVAVCPSDGWADWMLQGGALRIYRLPERGVLEEDFSFEQREWETKSCHWTKTDELVVEQRNCRDLPVPEVVSRDGEFVCKKLEQPEVSRQLRFHRGASGWEYDSHIITAGSHESPP